MAARLRSRPAPPPPGRSRRRLSLPRHRSTSAQVCAIYPAVVQAPLPQFGPLIGEDLSSGFGPLCWDPFETYDHGLVPNPNAFVMGEPGFAKSSLIKCWMCWQHSLYGSSRWLTVTDPKGEYAPVAERIGMTVVRLAPGGSCRINPLESHIGAGLAATVSVEDRSLQSAALYSLAGGMLERRLRPLERKALRGVVEVISDRPTTAPPTLYDVLDLLASPTGELVDTVNRSVDEWVRDVEDVRFALDELCTGTMRGMFDGASNVHVDWDGAGVVMDLSGVVDNERAMALAMVAAMGWARQQRFRVGDRQRVNVNDESYYMYRLAETVEFAQERRKLGRHYGEANIDICHRPSDLSAQADDGSRVAKMAAGLLPDSATRIVFRQAASELAGAESMLGLNPTEVACIASAKRGRALWRLGDRSVLGQHYRPAVLAGLTDTDGLMRRKSLLSPDDGPGGDEEARS